MDKILLDKKDAWLLEKYKWYTSNRGYACSKKGDKPVIILHRLIMNCPDSIQVDHINGDKLDNRRANLRLATRAQNQQNKLKCKGKYLKGVTKKKNRWQGQIGIEPGKREYLGSFLTEEEAHLSYCFAAIYFFGDFACGGYRD